MPLFRVTHRLIEFIEVEASDADYAKVMAPGLGPWYSDEDYSEVKAIEESERRIKHG